MLNFAENVKETRQAVQPKPSYPSNCDINEIQKRIKEIVKRFHDGIWLSRIPALYRAEYHEDLNTALLPQLEHWPHVCTVGSNSVRVLKMFSKNPAA